MRFAIVLLAFFLIALSATVSPLATLGSVEELYWWLRPGAYFTYLYKLPQPFMFVVRGYEYETDTLLINYTILDVVGSKAVVNFSLTFVNATVYESCGEIRCPVVEEMVNKTLHILLEIDLKTLGVYVNGSWVDEWLYLATINQLRGEAPKLVRVPSFVLVLTYLENTAEAQIIEAFYEMLREELGEDLVRCIQDANIVCEGFPPPGPGYIYPVLKPGERFVYLRTHGGYRVDVIKPPPSNFSFTIKNYTISGDRVAMIGAEPLGFERSILDSVRRGLLVVKKNVSIDHFRAYAFEVTFAPLKLYALRSFAIRGRPPEPLKIPSEEEDPFLKCVLYNPSRRETFLVTGLGCSGPFVAVTGYYDYYTGVLLHLNVSQGDIIFMPFQAYTRLLGVEEIVKLSPRLGPIPPSELSAELVLVDTNISFERPIIGGAEGGFNPVHVAIVAAIASIIIVGVKVALSRKARSTRRYLPTKAHQ
jgi:hypothetical protein